MPRAALTLSLVCLIPGGLQAGTLTLFASGEDLATEGFTEPRLTRDGWALEFTRILATLDRITAWQTDPPFLADGPAIAGVALEFPGPVTVDLVAADADHRVAMATLQAPEGQFNALSWAMVPAEDGEFAGQSLVLEGIARRGAEEVAFTLVTADAIGHACGEYLGETRKGFVTAGESADLEITLHLDHLFGRADRPADGEMNAQALGFDAFAGGGMQEFSLEGPHLGHVGEGHCHDSPL